MERDVDKCVMQVNFLIGYVRADCNDVTALGIGLSAPVNCILITVWVEATIREWTGSKSEHFPETALYIWQGGISERKSEFEINGLFNFWSWMLFLFVHIKFHIFSRKMYFRLWSVILTCVGGFFCYFCLTERFGNGR